MPEGLEDPEAVREELSEGDIDSFVENNGVMDCLFVSEKDGVTLTEGLGVPELVRE